MTLVDWRTRPAVELARCYDAERASWAQRFDWDTADNWRQVEQARGRGALPGFLVLDHDTPLGWTFFLNHHQTLQIGGASLLPSAVPPGDTLAALIDGVLASAEAQQSDSVMTFIPDTGIGLGDVLTDRGFSSRPFAYLYRAIEPIVPEAQPRLLSFHAGRLMAAADLFARAYPGADPARPFAPGGTSAEWTEYTAQLVTQSGCGTLLPWASIIEEDPQQPGRLIGGVITTRIAGQSAHLAQVAIDPAYQGQGKGVHLLRAVLARLFDRGYRHVSLLVADDNRPAAALYGRMGFSARGRFVSAWRAQPRRSTSAA